MAIFQSEGFTTNETISTIDLDTLSLMGIKPVDAKLLYSSILSTYNLSSTRPPPPSNDTQTVSLPPLSSCKFYFFPSFDTSDMQLRNRVEAMTDSFRRRYGKETIRDEGRGEEEKEIARLVDESACFVAFVTRGYMDKVMSGAETNQFEPRHYEFAYASVRRPRKMIAVVMEPELLDAGLWKGPVSARLGSNEFVDFSADDKLDKAVNKLGGCVLKCII